MIKPQDVEYGFAKTTEDLKQIVEMCNKNLMVNLTAEERTMNGFVFTPLNFDLVQKIFSLSKQSFAIAKLKKTNKIVSYLVYVDKKTLKLISQLGQIMRSFEKVIYKGKYLQEYQYLYALQGVVEKQYRKTFLYAALYNYLTNLIKEKKYDISIGAISKQNKVSLETNRKGEYVIVGSSSFLFNKQIVQCWIVVQDKPINGKISIPKSHL